jgi:hypothetical protein
MKIGKRTLAKLAVIISLFVFCGRSLAVCVSHSEDLSDALNVAKGVLESELFARTNGTPTAQQTREAKAITRALATLSLPATNTSQNYGLFLKAATQLGPLALDGPIGLAGANVFGAFTNQAQAEIDCTAERVGALGEFNRSKRPASNQLAQAQRSLNSIESANPQVALLLARVVYLKIVLANKLAGIGEAHPGFAPDGVAGKTLTHTEGGDTGTVQFINDTEANETPANDPVHMSIYMYDRNGLNTAGLKLTYPGDVAETTNTTNVKLKFLSSTNGTFTFRFEDADGSTGSGRGRFSLTP